MRVECPECGVVEEPAWVRGRASGELEIRCARCGVVSALAAEAFRPPPAPGGSAVTCPKCMNRQTNTESCDRCGLVFARWDPDRAAAPHDEAASALWANLDASWTDEPRHRAFVEYCTAAGLYAYAAQQYGRARHDEARRPRAEVEITRLTALAHAALAATAPASPRWSVRRIKAAVLIVTFVVCGALLVLLMSRLLPGLRR